MFYYPASRRRGEDDHDFSHDLTVVLLADRRTKVQVINRSPEGVLHSYEDIVFGTNDIETGSWLYYVDKKYAFKRLGYSHYKNKFTESTSYARYSMRNLWDLLAAYGLDSDALADLLHHMGQDEAGDPKVVKPIREVPQNPGQ